MREARNSDGPLQRPAMFWSLTQLPIRSTIWPLWMVLFYCVVTPAWSAKPPQPAYLTNAYFTREPIRAARGAARSEMLVNALVAQQPGRVGYFNLDVVFLTSGMHHISIDILDLRQKLVANLPFNPLRADASQGPDMYTVVGGILGKLPEGVLLLAVKDRVDNGPKVNIGTFSVVVIRPTKEELKAAKAQQHALDNQQETSLEPSVTEDPAGFDRLGADRSAAGAPSAPLEKTPLGLAPDQPNDRTTGADGGLPAWGANHLPKGLSTLSPSTSLSFAGQLSRRLTMGRPGSSSTLKARPSPTAPVVDKLPSGHLSDLDLTSKLDPASINPPPPAIEWEKLNKQGTILPVEKSESADREQLNPNAVIRPDAGQKMAAMDQPQKTLAQNETPYDLEKPSERPAPAFTPESSEPTPPSSRNDADLQAMDDFPGQIDESWADPPPGEEPSEAISERPPVEIPIEAPWLRRAMEESAAKNKGAQTNKITTITKADLEAEQRAKRVQRSSQARASQTREATEHTPKPLATTPPPSQPEEKRGFFANLGSQLSSLFSDDDEETDAPSERKTTASARRTQKEDKGTKTAETGFPDEWFDWSPPSEDDKPDWSVKRQPADDAAAQSLLPNRWSQTTFAEEKPPTKRSAPPSKSKTSTNQEKWSVPAWSDLLNDQGPLPTPATTAPDARRAEKRSASTITIPEAIPSAPASSLTLAPKSAMSLMPPPPTATEILNARPEPPPPKVGPPVRTASRSSKPVRHLIQLASYNDKRSAVRLQQRLEILGMPSLRHLLRSKGRRFHRISAGPFPSLEDAQLAQRIIEQELSLSDTRLQSLPDKPSPVPQPPRQANRRQSPPTQAIQPPTPALPQVRKAANRQLPSGSTLSIQLASFSNHSGAVQLRKQLRNMGLPSYQYPTTVKGSTFIRVNVGPFLNRRDAVIADCVVRQKLRITGKTGSDQRLDRRPPRPARPLFLPTRAGKGVQLHLASFTDRQRANNLRQHLIRIGIQPLVSRVTAQQKRFIRINAGPFANRLQAEMAACLIKERFKINPSITKNP
ncbi:MAG: SPOR domain-containing protein [Magnetococcales bacterium]|nr:SPOR domain-containing protein [Magnetococcales bacterium]